MSSSVVTEVDAPYARDPQTRDAARRYLQRSGNADLLEVLGLAELPARPVAPSRCGLCGNPLPKHGVCRKRIVCRAAAEQRAAESRAERQSATAGVTR